MQMQIVIDIPEDRYDEIHSLKFVIYGLQSEENRKLFYRLINAVQDGTPLPKGHGRLIDESEIQYNEIWITHENGGRTCIGWEADIENAPTILEADKEI